MKKAGPKPSRENPGSHYGTMTNSEFSKNDRGHVHISISQRYVQSVM